MVHNYEYSHWIVHFKNDCVNYTSVKTLKKLFDMLILKLIWKSYCKTSPKILFLKNKYVSR